ncbi:MAG: ABC transporter ATP-binding protein [Cytophagales bacterium]|nr:MAG: ABC transporter ATP-binding protein [Cytophagales bacterium]
MRELKYLNKYLYKYKYRLMLGFVFVILTNIFGIVQGPIIRKVVDDLTSAFNQYHSISEPSAKSLFKEEFIFNTMKYGVLILVMTLISGIFLFFVRQFIIAASRRIEYDLKNEIYAHYQTLPLGFYRKNNTGDLMSRISEDVSAVRMYLGPSIMYFLNLISLFSIAIAIMFSVDTKLATYVLIPLPLLALSIYLVHSKMDEKSTQIQQGLSRLSTFVQEAFSGIRVVKSFAREEEMLDRFEKESLNYKEKSLSLTTVNSFFYPLILTLTGLSIIIIVYLGGIEVIEGRVSYGNITEFIFYLNKLTWPVTSLGWTTSLVQRAEASQRRINEFLNTKTDIVSQKNLEKPIEGNIKFENVSFSYPESGITALKNISFEVAAGESIAIIGTTGSGKTTLANLICRMYDVGQGKITIDDTNIVDYNIFNLRNSIGYVPQDVFLFSDTIRNNVAFGAHQFSESEIIAATKDADLYQNISQFPNGLDTIVGERGITLSGGQKQRVSIARAILRAPRIIILDDALSAVDTQTEHAILNSLERLMKGKTTLIISHRISSVKLANKILVLHNGEIVEQGTHQALIVAGGIYKDLYEKQLEQKSTAKA